MISPVNFLTNKINFYKKTPFLLDKIRSQRGKAICILTSHIYYDPSFAELSLLLYNSTITAYCTRYPYPLPFSGYFGVLITNDEFPQNCSNITFIFCEIFSLSVYAFLTEALQTSRRPNVLHPISFPNLIFFSFQSF